jgi:hypothetical protein
MDSAFALPTSQVLSRLGADEVNGLSDEQVLELRLQHGKNGK